VESELEPEPVIKSGEVLEGEVMEAELGKKNKTESTEPEEDSESPEPVPEFLDEEESLASKLEEFLHDLHVTPRIIFTAIGGVVLLVVLYYGGLAGWGAYKNWQQAKSAEQILPSSTPAEAGASGSAKQISSSAQPTMPETPVNQAETGVPSVQKVGKPSTIGPFSVNQTGITSAIVVGSETLASTAISYRLNTFGKIDNAYSVNVEEMLNKTSSRRQKLREYIDLLKGLVDEGTKISQTSGAEMAVMQASYDEKVLRQKTSDEEFFAKMNAYEGKETERVLGEFIVISRDIIEVRAKFKALQKIKLLFDQALPKVLKRIKDLEINEEALVSGIKVYDVSGSDLNLILPATGDDGQSMPLESTGGATGGGAATGGEGSGGALSAFPLFPINPANISGANGRDFITQPGGGAAKFTPLPIGTTTGSGTRVQ
jgi:hypothetical protein